MASNTKQVDGSANSKTVSLDDAFIVVMGLTGTGKSTFICRCTGERSTIAGHGLESYTRGVTLHTIERNNRKIHLIDTPGFDDSNKADGEVLEELTFWLLKSYNLGIRLSGIVYLHRITDPRMQGSALHGLELFKELCGRANYSGIVLATTHWDEVNAELGQRRQRELEEDKRFWGDLRSNGSSITRIGPGPRSALEIVDRIVQTNQRLVLDIQRQMADEGKSIGDTNAGRILQTQFLQQKAEMERQQTALSFELRAATAQHHDKRVRNLRKTIAQCEQIISSKEHAARMLERDTETLTEDWEAKLQSELDILQQKRKDRQLQMERLRGSRKTLGDTTLQRNLQHEREMRQLNEEIERLKKVEAIRVGAHSYSPPSKSRAVKTAFDVVAGATGLAMAIVPTVACAVM